MDVAISVNDLDSKLEDEIKKLREKQLFNKKLTKKYPDVKKGVAVNGSSIYSSAEVPFEGSKHEVMIAKNGQYWVLAYVMFCDIRVYSNVTRMIDGSFIRESLVEFLNTKSGRDRLSLKESAAVG